MRVWVRDATLIAGRRDGDEIGLVGRNADGRDTLIRVPVRHRLVCTGAEAAVRNAARTAHAPVRPVRFTRIAHEARYGPAAADGFELRVPRFYDLQRVRLALPGAGFFGAPATREEACAHFLRDRGGTLFDTWHVRSWEAVRASRVGSGAVLEVRAHATDVGPERGEPLQGSLRACCLDIETAFSRDAPDPDEVLCASLHFFDVLTDGAVERVQLVVEDARCAEPSLASHWDASDGSLRVCSGERALLQLLMNLLVEKEVELVMGWNSNGFDVPHLAKRARLAGVVPFPLSRWNDDSFHLSSKNVVLRGAHQRLTEVRGGGFGVLYWDPLAYLRTKDILKSAVDLKLGTVAALVLGERDALAAKDPVPYAQIYSFWTGTQRSQLVKYCDKDTSMCRAIVARLRLLDGVLAESRMLSLSVHALGACGQNARALACLDLTGRQQEPPALLPLRARSPEAAVERHVLHIGWRNAADREARLAAPLRAERSREHYRKGPNGAEKTCVVEFDTAAERDAAGEAWARKGYHVYSAKDVDRVAGGFVRQQARLRPLEGEAPRAGGAALPMVMVMDFASLYPSVMRAYGIDRSSVLSWAEARALGYAEAQVTFCPQRHVLDRSVGAETPSPLPAPGKRWPTGLGAVRGKDAVVSLLAGSDYELVFDSPEELQVVERITDETTVVLKAARGLVPVAIVLQLAQRKRWKQEKTARLQAGDAAGAAAADANQLACKESANSMYGVSLCEGGPLFSDRVGRLIPQMGREAAMRLSEVLYTRDWAAHFAEAPAAPARVDAELFRNLNLLLARAFGGGARFAVVYGDTDSVFVRPPCALSAAAAGALNLHLCDFFTHRVFGDGILELEAENVYFRYLGVGQKRYAALAFSCLGELEPGGGAAPDRPRPVRVVAEPGAGRPPVHATDSDPDAPLFHWFRDGSFALGSDGPPLADWEPAAAGRRSPARRLPEVLCAAGLGRALQNAPSVKIKGLECVKRSCLGALRGMQLRLVLAAVLDAANTEEALAIAQKHLRWLACGAAPPTQFFASTKLSKHPGDDFREYIEGKRKLSGTENYQQPNKALVVCKELFQAGAAHAPTDGEQATQERMTFFIKRTWTANAKVAEHAYPVAPSIDTGETPSRLHPIYHSILASVKTIFAAIWPAADVRALFFCPAGELPVYRKLREWRESPFQRHTVHPARAIAAVAPCNEDERAFLASLASDVESAQAPLPAKQWVACVDRVQPRNRWECTPRFWRYGEDACAVCGEARCSHACDPSAAFAETQAALAALQKQCAECRSTAGYADIEDAVRACDNRDCMTLYDRRHLEARRDFLRSEL